MRIIKSNYWKEGSTIKPFLFGSGAIFYKSAQSKLNPFPVKDKVKYSDLTSVIIVMPDNVISVLNKAGWQDDGTLNSLALAKDKKNTHAAYLEFANERRAIIAGSKTDVAKLANYVGRNKIPTANFIMSPEFKMRVGKLGLLLIIGYVIYRIYSAPPVQQTEAQKQEHTQDTIVQMVKQTVTANLKDPSSAEFGPMGYRKNKSGVEVVCGTFNAKNSFGGYAGKTGFIYFIAKDKLVYSNQYSNYNRDLDKYCSN